MTKRELINALQSLPCDDSAQVIACIIDTCPVEEVQLIGENNDTVMLS